MRKDFIESALSNHTVYRAYTGVQSKLDNPALDNPVFALVRSETKGTNQAHTNFA
jgi:hypothetical protein